MKLTTGVLCRLCRIIFDMCFVGLAVGYMDCACCTKNCRTEMRIRLSRVGNWVSSWKGRLVSDVTLGRHHGLDVFYCRRYLQTAAALHRGHLCKSFGVSWNLVRSTMVLYNTHHTHCIQPSLRVKYQRTIFSIGVCDYTFCRLRCHNEQTIFVAQNRTQVYLRHFRPN